MSDSDRVIPESEVSWTTDFHNLTQEYDIPYSVVCTRCEPGGLYMWRADLSFLKRKSVGFGNSKALAKEAAAKNAFPWLRLQNEEKIRRKSQSSQFGAVRAERGFQNESAALRALQDDSFKRPEWFKSVRRADREEDKRGIDIVVETHDVGRLYLQVKSSKVFARRFAEKRRPSLIGLIVASYSDDPKELHRRAMDELETLYRQVIARRDRSCG